MTQAGDKTDSAGPAGFPAESTHPRTLTLLVRGKNIHEKSLLATDYLNHFNEVIMLLDMVPGMPECLEDVKAWAPKSYEEHFRESTFADKDLAILAYQNAPSKFRLPFDRTVDKMNAVVADGIEDIQRALATKEQGRVDEAVAAVAGKLHRLIDMASAIIHGDERTVDQTGVDAILDS